MTMVCAWCRALIARSPTRSRGPYERNYGMCRRCVEEQLARLEPAPRKRRAAARSVAEHEENVMNALGA
jgi:hypothetical protein